MISNDNMGKELSISTSALAKELNKSSPELFQELADKGLIVKNSGSWELTDAGRLKGGDYRQQDKYGRYIVWKDSFVAEMKGLQKDDGQHLLTSTAIGKRFLISASRTNSILSELGLIEKSIKGWVLTDFGNRLGGQQFHEKVSGVPYVRWPDTITRNKMFISSVYAIKGEISASPSPETNVSSDETEFRDKYKPTQRATDGHYVRSKAELLIDNWLYMSEQVHAYERRLPIEEEVYSDFYIPKGKVYIEYWGYEEDSKYLMRKEEKLAIYKKYGFHLIELSDKEVQNLDDTLPRLLLAFGIRTE